ncbi:MAG: ComEA family DNA-binding protein [Clostridia bacterium]|nr:ComEA family DNA-binding protein [Clostridia bacterium]
MDIKAKNLLIAVLVVTVVAVALSFIRTPVIKETKTINLPKICVHIKGAVRSPGMYELDAASRVNDAIVIAGGALDSANINAVNLARFLEDGEEIIIPIITSEADSDNESLKVNINTADIEKLCELDGIGEITARQIIEYRSIRGGFLVKEEIMNVSGIGETLFERIKDKICVN